MVTRVVVTALVAMGAIVGCSGVLRAGAAGGDATAVRIGVLAFRGRQICLQRWSATAVYLGKRVPGHKFAIIPLTLGEMGEAVEKKTVDFILTNTGNYVELEARFGISRIATLRKRTDAATGNSFGAVIFVKADRQDINRLTDLRDKRFMAVKRHGFGGFQMAWRELKKHGIDPFKDFAELRFSGFPQDKVALAVRRGEVDAGTFRTGTLRAMAAEGKISLSEFRILQPQIHPGFPYSATTRLYPEWPFAKLRSTSPEVSQLVAIALLGMPTGSPAAVAGQYAGWTVPLDYQPVHELFRELQIGPYADLGRVTVSKILTQYGPWIYLSALLLVLTLTWTIWVEYLVKRRTRELSIANEQLALEIAERRNIERTAMERQNELARIARLNTMGEMASGLAHQLNHPLATIANYATGCVRRLRHGTFDSKELLPVMEQVSDQARHAADIVNSMRSLIRKDELTRAPTDLNAVICDAMGLLEFDAAKNGVAVGLDLAETLPMVVADAIQVEQVVINLARNAIEAMDGSQQRRKEVRVATASNGNRAVEVRVWDSGPGMPGEMAGTAFDPFVTTKAKGLGLGLSISRSIIESHGGTLAISSTGRDGTEFRFQIPTAETQ